MIRAIKHILKFPKYFIILVLILGACDSENAGDCFQASGTIITTEVDVSSFQNIQIEGDVTLYITQGETQKVLLETGENLLPDILVEVTEDTLIIRDTNNCNFVREHGTTIVRVTIADLKRIRNASSYDVIGEGSLVFDTLELISNTSGNLQDPKKVGDFYLTLESEDLNINANGQSVFYLNGNVENVKINFTDENPRFEGANLRIGNLEILQRSANKMIVFPVNSVEGSILGTGDVIAKNRPPIVDVEESFTGRLVFED